jgi:hypothetical protein
MKRMRGILLSTILGALIWGVILLLLWKLFLLWKFS